MDDRDHFAAAALTGFIRGMPSDSIFHLDLLTRQSYEVADAMLRERSRAGQKMAESDSSRAVCPERDNANHDAAPAARAPADSCVPRGAVDRDSVGTDKAEPLTSDCGTGDISEAQIDALECVVEDGRIVGMSVYGHLRSLLVRLRPEWESDRSKPINDERLDALEELSALDQELELKHGIKGNPMIKARPCKAADLEPTPPRNGAPSGCKTVPDPDSRVWETPCTPQAHATPPKGSVQGEYRDSRNTKEPVAWAVLDSRGAVCVAYTCREAAEAYCEGTFNRMAPLYRHPQPTRISQEQQEGE